MYNSSIEIHYAYKAFLLYIAYINRLLFFKPQRNYIRKYCKNIGKSEIEIMTILYRIDNSYR